MPPAPGTVPVSALIADVALPTDVDDPIAVLTSWLPGVPGRDGYFPLVTLATVDEAGHPDARTVLLSEVADDEMFFHTDRTSRKATQLAGHPFAAMCLVLPERARQIVVRGAVSPASRTEQSAAYENRSRYLQLLAWQNTPSVAALPPADRIEAWARFDRDHPTLDPPRDWIGFRLTPDRITFWHGATDGPSHRVAFDRTDSGWRTTELPG